LYSEARLKSLTLNGTNQNNKHANLPEMHESSSSNLSLLLELTLTFCF